ncbi:DNA helicase [Tanacetum coccineum]
MFQCSNEVISIIGQIGSEKYFDETFEYRHVVLPPEVNTYGEEEDGGSVKIRFLGGYCEKDDWGLCIKSYSKVIVNRFSKLSFRDALLEQVGLMVLEEIHPLGADCGSILEDLISGADSVSVEETTDDKWNVIYVHEIDGPRHSDCKFGIGNRPHIWDEAPMNDRWCFETLDWSHRDILDTPK